MAHASLVLLLEGPNQCIVPSYKMSALPTGMKQQHSAPVALGDCCSHFAQQSSNAVQKLPSGMLVCSLICYYGWHWLDWKGEAGVRLPGILLSFVTFPGENAGRLCIEAYWVQVNHVKQWMVFVWMLNNHLWNTEGYEEKWSTTFLVPSPLVFHCRPVWSITENIQICWGQGGVER